MGHNQGGFHGKTDQRINACKGFLDLREMVDQRVVAVEIKRRPYFLCDRADLHRFAVEFPVFEFKVMHGAIFSNS